jgi:simple sugar transport system substrate-binding protein
MILVGPYDDKGWNQAHYEGITQYVQKRMPNVKFEYVDKVNPADRPNVKGTQVAADLVAKGAKMIIFNSDDFKDDALEFAKKNPTIAVIHASGDYSWKDGKNYKSVTNHTNAQPEMEYGHMINGCNAALQTQTGKIAILGPLINEETRRYSSSAYLGAKYCWEKYRGKKAEDLKFKVDWIGFWFNIPGVTQDPTKVVDQQIALGYDVILSQIDTPEAAQQAKKATAAGKKVWYVHYGHPAGCDVEPDVCLGVAYYNWGPEYMNQVNKAIAGKFGDEWVRMKADWAAIDSREKTGFGYHIGKGASADSTKNLNDFIKGLGDGSINLLKGPIKFQDGSDYVKDGATGNVIGMWYLPQLLQGMEGKSK